MPQVIFLSAYLFFASIGLASFAQACERPVAIDNTQVRELLKTVKNDKADELDQVFAMETLMCAKRSTIVSGGYAPYFHSHS